MPATFLLLLLFHGVEADLGGLEPGTPIVSIQIVRHDVFDLSNPATSTWPYRTANKLHVLSRESFIRSMLLFEEGDALIPARLAETERLLRQTGLLDPVHVTASPVEGGAAVLVETWDQWTTDVSLNFNQIGGRSKSGISISEPNFAGYGKKVELDYRSDEERDSVTLRYADPLLAGTRWRLRASYSDASDGLAQKFRLEYPFFSLETPFAAGVEWNREDLREWLWSDTEKVVSGDAQLRSLRVWGGMRLPGNGERTNRVIVGFFRDVARYSSWRWDSDGAPFRSPEDRRMQGLSLGWEGETNRWDLVSGFRSWKKQEDVPLGPNWRTLVGISTPELGGDRTRLLLEADLLLGRMIGVNYDWLETGLSGRVEAGELVNGVASVEIGRAATGGIGWRGRVKADFGTRLDRDRQLTLGADTGLRGWGPDTFDGTSRAVANLEWRKQITDEFWNIGIIGFEAFADAGSTWNARIGRSTEGVHADVGVGLLVEITRAASFHVLRLEVAMPDDGSGPVFLATSGSLF